MRVALDLAPTRLAAAGVARYARTVEAALAARSDVEVLPLGGGPTLARGTVGRRALALRQDLAWYPRGLRHAARRAGADVLHLTTLRGPLHRGIPPSVLTVHDLVPLHEPHTLSRWNRLYTAQTLVRVLRAADVLVADSSDTAADVEAIVPGARVVVVPIAVDGSFLEPAPGPPPVDGPYVLFVGTPEPRKNLGRLVAAMRGRPERLVLAGSDGWGPAIEAAPGIVRLGRVGDGSLHALYAGAVCLAIPSLHEGYGLPAVEAMAAGCPVVAAERGALPEVCGGAAVLVDPLDPDAIAAGVDAALARADELRVLGRARAAELSPERMAAGLVAAYELAGARGA